MRLLSLAGVLAVTLGGVGAAPADNYPSKPITIVVGFAPGGPTDSSARILAEKMKDTLGQSVIVENQSGAAGTIAYNRVGHADPDGYTLYLGNWTVNVGAVTMFPVQFDPLTGFEPVAMLTTSKLWIVARKELPANNPREFVAWLKANPGKGNAASVGVGSAAHVCLVDLANRSGTKFQYITYRGGAPAVQALASGEADFSCLEGGQTLALYRSGKVKIIGVVAKTRWAGAPEVPTFEEGGVPGLELLFWHGLWAPKGTPKPIVEKINHAVGKAFDDDWVKQRFAELGHTIPPPDQRTPEALYKHHKAEVEKWWPIMKAAGIKPKGS
jgi:tripartite-type tricarboxylate transporter receptor subunit TctC